MKKIKLDTSKLQLKKERIANLTNQEMNAFYAEMAQEPLLA